MADTRPLVLLLLLLLMLQLLVLVLLMMMTTEHHAQSQPAGQPTVDLAGGPCEDHQSAEDNHQSSWKAGRGVLPVAMGSSLSPLLLLLLLLAVVVVVVAAVVVVVVATFPTRPGGAVQSDQLHRSGVRSSHSTPPPALAVC